MATLRDSLLPALDAIRGIPVVLGLRPHTVSVFQRVYSGTSTGIGNSVDVTTSLRIDLGTFSQLKVRNVTQRDIIASGGLYTDQDVVVGPITPPFTGSAADNDAISVFDPPPNGSPTEVFFKITGPGYPATGAYFKKIGQRVDQPFRFMLYLRKTAEIP